jgi:hypothetical protein
VFFPLLFHRDFPDGIIVSSYSPSKPPVQFSGSTILPYFDRPAALCQSLFTTFTDTQRHPKKIKGLLVPLDHL